MSTFTSISSIKWSLLLVRVLQKLKIVSPFMNTVCISNLNKITSPHNRQNQSQFWHELSTCIFWENVTLLYFLFIVNLMYNVTFSLLLCLYIYPNLSKAGPFLVMYQIILYFLVHRAFHFWHLLFIESARDWFRLWYQSNATAITKSSIQILSPIWA